jgi:hypothetical protein
MYKALCVATLLLATFALTSGSKFADASPATPPSPVIVARAKLVNQTAPIPTTTIFTPTQTGLFRFSAYTTQTMPVSGDSRYWSINLYWTDDAGPQLNTQLIQCVCGGFGSVGWPSGTVGIFEATAGQPVSYSVSLPSGTDGGTYSLYYTIERLE